MITIVLVGGPEDGAVWQVPYDDPPPVWLLSVAPTWADLITRAPGDPVAPIASQTAVWRLDLDPYLHRPSRTDDGAYRYRWEGIR